MGCEREGYVSIWAGTFASIEMAEEYFGIPDEIGVDLPPEVFARDLGVDDLPAERLEVLFDQPAPRPIVDLLRQATFSASFLAAAGAAAQGQGVVTAQGIALVYDFDYEAEPGWQGSVGPLQFIGSFRFVATQPQGDVNAVPDPRLEIRELTDDLL
jgi:hypothetical protein